jgi:starch phosphorylase
MNIMHGTAQLPSPVLDLREAIAAKLLYQLGADPGEAELRDWYAATALALRDRLVERWMSTGYEARKEGRKLVYYMSLEFLIGRLLTDTISNLGLMEEARAALASHGVDFDELRELEPDAGLGNGGLGRLAACFMESMATVGVAGFGYGIRYDHGLFRQVIRDGWQIEMPETWLSVGNPWEFERPDVAYEVGFGGRVDRIEEDGRVRHVWKPEEHVLAVAFDTPTVGWRGQTVNTLRLWSARSLEPMRLDTFNRGEHLGAFADHIRSTSISRVLYPDDSSPAGQELRLRQEFFFTSASLQDMLRQHKKRKLPLEALADHATCQLNDTHPALAVVELLRLLVDENGMALEPAFEIVRRTLAYTNHTLLPEALETWPLPLFERLLPRHLQLVFEVNKLHLDEIAKRPDCSLDMLASTSLLDEHGERRVRMGHLAFVGSRKVNGVSALHGKLVRQTVFSDLHNIFPDRITHITNGVTFRRWLVQSNPGLTALITEAIGSSWIDDAEHLKALAPFADDSSFCDRAAEVKRANKERLAAHIRQEIGIATDPAAMFDVHIKRIHEYKRQLLNLLETVARYQAIRAEPNRDWTPRVKIFAGKAAASYWRAKLIIKLINDVAQVVNNDPIVGDRLKVAFLPNYNVSLAERIIPAANLSEQISTAGMEASGTGNLKLALNGALTIGTLDGANIEIKELIGEENVFIFGMNAAEVVATRLAGYNPHATVEATPALARALESIRCGTFSPEDWHRFAALVDDLLNGDYFLVTADFSSYRETQSRADALYKRQAEWRRKSVLNTAGSGWFSSDRTIRQYADEIWGVTARVG